MGGNTLKAETEPWKSDVVEEETNGSARGAADVGTQMETEV